MRLVFSIYKSALASQKMPCQLFSFRVSIIRAHDFVTYFLLCILALSSTGSVLAQDDMPPKSENYWRFMFAGGIMYQQSDAIIIQPAIKKAIMIDPAFSISIFSDQPNGGWMIEGRSTTKNCRYAITYANQQQMHSLSNTSDRYYQIGINRTYRINLNKYMEGMLTFGPLIILNPSQSNYYDRISNNSDMIDKINIAQIGAGLDMSAYILQRHYENCQFAICINYQKGFFGLYETDVYTPNQSTPATYRYYGSGFGLKTGLLF